MILHKHVFGVFCLMQCFKEFPHLCSKLLNRNLPSTHELRCLISKDQSTGPTYTLTLLKLEIDTFLMMARVQNENK